MKIIYSIILLSVLSGGFARAQDQNADQKLAQLLEKYYQIKDALVTENQQMAAEEAAHFIKTLNGISYKTISEGNVHIMLKDAEKIADSKTIEQQRKVFANFSDNMVVLVKGLHLAGAPVYLQYCPMKKASWLSKEQTIKNPYYGNKMLGCGKVSETIR